MIPHLGRSWLAATVVLLLPSAPAPAEAARGTKVFCWKASSSTAEVHLMGSIHLGREDFYPLAPEIEAAFQRAKFLVLEIDETKSDPVKAQGLLLEKGMYPGAETIQDHLPKDMMRRLSELSERLHLPGAAVARMRPWLLSVTLSLMSIQQLGYASDLGIDRHFLAEAKKQNKDVLELESAEFQTALLSGFSEETQIKFLATTLDEAAMIQERMTRMVEAWKKGDAAALEKDMAQHPENAAFQEKMIDERNLSMAKKIGGYLTSNNPHFVVVGAAHLIGEKGIVRLLEKDGFKVEQLEKP